MTYCYVPAILLFILSILIIISGIGSMMRLSIVFGLIPLFFAIISLILCKQGYTIISWIMLVCPFIVFSMIMAGKIPVPFLLSSTTLD